MEKKPSALARIYARLIENGSRTLQEVPMALQPEVKIILEENKGEFENE